MSRLSNFKEFYLKVVLPNTLSYKNYFNEGNFDKNMNDLIKKYQESYGFNPFEDSISLKDLDIKPIDNIFEDYSNSKGSGVPRAIINTHYRKFLTYQEDIHFENLQELINRINEAFRKDNFIEKFQRKRTEFNGNSRVASNDVIFGDVRDNYWTINKGSEKELQYHINNDGKYIGYGLGFNAQPSQNNHSPMEYVIPFVKSFINNRIYDKLQDYQFVNSSLEDLKNISYGDFILFGKKIELKEDKSIEGIKLLELIYDLEGKQFEAYKLIFSNANLIKENKMNIENEIQKYTDLLHYKPQIILQGPPGTGKTREAKRIAKALLGLGENDSLEGNEQFKLIQFHPSYSYEDFVRGIIAETVDEKIKYSVKDKILGSFAQEALKDKDKPYVLVIDEINRANLSAVLGELIYALEYRGEAVQSMYAIEGENNLTLPPNLYIIGTMNTADRSVGHIDYAIRRRFAFVNILPKDLTNELGDQFESALFAKVTNLFNTNLSSEFKKEEVQLGHSYFITKNTPIDIRWEYEIKPILFEYVKDGILVGEGIETTINNLINDENNAS
ncbi:MULTISPECIES: McrB family protein [Capnocytophaga]|uniref:McrB family protein n=1 Tax=Capnocytophaga TaxID=1016 RepID=UPI00020C690D|nr:MULTISPECIES: AAA family ATPase [unclassified Capnocytophaga]KHE71381.1 ATPase family protein [Capnocytophaga sp. oral taxon 329 str. F0087]QGS17800.1 AAA domain-containing protein [Capnocytophaga sp. FDAARGOS_737]